MKLKAHSPIEGKQVGEIITVEKGLGEWYVTNGYAVEVDKEKRLPGTSSERIRRDPEVFTDLFVKDG